MRIQWIVASRGESRSTQPSINLTHPILSRVGMAHTPGRSCIMTAEINGFAIEQSSSHRHLFRRVTEPRHEYIFEITSKRIVLRATLPHVGVDRGDALAACRTWGRFVPANSSASNWAANLAENDWCDGVW
jgi:hypothetical protein